MNNHTHVYIKWLSTGNSLIYFLESFRLQKKTKCWNIRNILSKKKFFFLWITKKKKQFFYPLHSVLSLQYTRFDIQSKLCCGLVLSATITPTTFHVISLNSKSSRINSSKLDPWRGKTVASWSLKIVRVPKYALVATIANRYFLRSAWYDISYLFNKYYH